MKGQEIIMNRPLQHHSFYIPVMGTGFTIDTILRVGRYGITSVISLVDDSLIEEARRYYAEQFSESYEPVTKNHPDCRAERIRRYLDLCDLILAEQIASIRDAGFKPGSEACRYFELLPDSSQSRMLYNKMLSESDTLRREALQEQLRELIVPGAIDVNVMTKVDRQAWADDEKLPAEQSDAMAALRGFALSTVNSSIVFSAGLHRRLFTYMESFPGFYPDKNGVVKKHVILKVSDYRSAIVQGKCLARKGIWVDEFRIESGLNCGGHAFPTAGLLLGKVLDEFRSRREELLSELLNTYGTGITAKGFCAPAAALHQRITVQGGITSADEHRLMLSLYGADAAGWGTPWLLVPEATRVQPEIITALARARAEDVKLSQASPLNVPFSNLLTSMSELGRKRRLQEGNPGAVCRRGHLAFNTEFTKKPVCTASAIYQRLKSDAISVDQSLTEEERRSALVAVTEKACLCYQLGGSAMVAFGSDGSANIETAICPGPNIAYFNRKLSLEEMTGHIYGRIDLVKNSQREHFLVTEIRLYIAHLATLITDFQRNDVGEPAKNNIAEFIHNLKAGVTAYMEKSKRHFEENFDCYEMFIADVSKTWHELECLDSQFTKLAVL